MKKIITLLAAIAFCISAFAQTPEHVAKANKYAKQTAILCLDLISGEDVTDDMTNLGESIGLYIVELETEEKITEFLLKYNEFIYYYFEEYELGKEVADEYLKSFYEAFLGES